MIPYGGKDLADAFRTVRKNTLQVAQDIPEDKYDFVAATDARPVGKMLVHIAIATRIWEEIHCKGHTTLEAFDYHGLMDKLNAQENKPSTKAQTLNPPRSEDNKFAAWLESLTPESLSE